MSRIVDRLITAIALLAFVYHGVYVLYPIESQNEFLNVHLAFILVLVFLRVARKNRKQCLIMMPIIILSLVVIGYVKISYPRLETALSPTLTDVVVGAVLIALVIECCRRAVGLIIPIMVLLFLAYFFLGSYLPMGPFRTAKIDPADIVHMLTFQFAGAGIYGVLLVVSAYFVFLFAVMGALIQITGAPQLFRYFGSILGKRLRGGPALMAVGGSALMGTITGIATANIMVTGSFTIPLMKKVGYSPKEAAAIESVASNGGQIMPPVLGSTAFVISMITGIRYVVIMVASVIPALLYFLAIALYVQLLAVKKKVAPMDTLGEGMDTRLMLLSAPGFLVPLGTVICLFVLGFSPMYVALFGALSALIMSFLRPGKRLSWSELSNGITTGVMAGATVGATLAAMGVLVKVLTATGLGIKLPAIVETLSYGNTGLALLLVMATCIILGMGIPTTPAYILVAIAAAPVLVHMGVSVLAAHFFVFYFAVMALITPPVAAAAVLSSQIAGASYIGTAMQCLKIGLTGLLIPFIFILNPVFLMQPGQGLLEGIVALLAGLVMVVSLTGAFVNYGLIELSFLERVLLMACFISCFVYLVFMGNQLLIGGATILFLLVAANQLRKSRLSGVASNR